MPNYRILVIFLLALVTCSSSYADRTTDLVQAAHARTQANVTYNGAYFPIAYPNGDVPQEYGVCTDVVIRSYRKLGDDLQQLVHEDMRTNFSLYPANRLWHQTRTDRNIDHRRVPNLQVFFARHGQVLPTTDKGSDYQAGDLVTWLLGGKLPHIGIVVDGYSHDGERPLIIHNVGAGPELADVLFSYPITGHYRFRLN